MLKYLWLEQKGNRNEQILKTTACLGLCFFVFEVSSRYMLERNNRNCNFLMELRVQMIQIPTAMKIV